MEGIRLYVSGRDLQLGGAGGCGGGGGDGGSGGGDGGGWQGKALAGTSQMDGSDWVHGNGTQPYFLSALPAWLVYLPGSARAAALVSPRYRS